MSKTKLDVKNDIKESVKNCSDFESMIENIAKYIIRNYKLKKNVILEVKEKSDGSK